MAHENDQKIIVLLTQLIELIKFQTSLIEKNTLLLQGVVVGQQELTQAITSVDLNSIQEELFKKIK